jgi:heme/copper-type cytochrome/quinol oxidase subunit 1
VVRVVAVVRRFGVLAVGIAAIVAGMVVYQFRPTPVASFGWVAYAPLSDSTFVPFLGSAVWAAGLLVLIGFVLVAGWVGFAFGRRRAPGA